MLQNETFAEHIHVLKCLPFAKLFTEGSADRTTLSLNNIFAPLTHSVAAHLYRVATGFAKLLGASSALTTVKA